MPADARKLGIDALKAGRFADAAKYLSGFIGSAPNDQEARLAFALALSGRGDHDKALIHLDKLLTKSPNSAGLHYHRGLVLERAKRFDQARREFRRVLELDPKHARARAKLPSAAPPADVGFEVLDDEPQYEVVEDENEAIIAESVDEDIVGRQLADSGDDVIETDIFEEVWADDKRKPLDAATIAKYGVLLLAVIGAAAFGFSMFASTLALIFAIGVGSGAILLGIADYVRRGGNSSSTFWVLHVCGLGIVIATVVGVLVAHRMSPNEEPNREAVPPSDTVRPNTRGMRVDNEAVDRIINDLNSGTRGRELSGLSRLATLAPNAKRDEVASLLEKFLNKNEPIYRIPALRAARIWGNRKLLPTLQRFANETTPGLSQLAKDAIQAIEQQP